MHICIHTFEFNLKLFVFVVSFYGNIFEAAGKKRRRIVKFTETRNFDDANRKMLSAQPKFIFILILY